MNEIKTTFWSRYTCSLLYCIFSTTSIEEKSKRVKKKLENIRGSRNSAFFGKAGEDENFKADVGITRLYYTYIYKRTLKVNITTEFPNSNRMKTRYSRRSGIDKFFATE